MKVQDGDGLQHRIALRCYLHTKFGNDYLSNMETKFNFKSQICTDIIQSERLLSLGLKKETADMCSVIDHVSDGGKWEEVDTIFSFTPDDWNFRESVTPRWSLHRLIEMMPENVSDDWLGVSFDEISYYHGEYKDEIGWKYYKAGNLYDCIIECYKWLIKEGYFNKEYLCEK